jgi:hypothetical protein
MDEDAVMAIGASTGAARHLTPLDDVPNDILLVGRTLWVSQGQSLQSFNASDGAGSDFEISAEVAFGSLLKGQSNDFYALIITRDFIAHFDETGEQLGDWISLDEYASDVEYGAGSLWVTYGGDEPYVRRLDPFDGTIMHEWRHPGNYVDSLSIEITTDSLWTATDRGVLSRLNLTSGIFAQIADLQRPVDFLIAMNNEVWAVDEDASLLRRVVRPRR